MDKADGRKLSEESLQLLRRQAHRLRQEHKTWDEIAAIVGLHRSTVMSWVNRYRLNEEQPAEVASTRRGRLLGDKRTLGLEDERRLREQIVSGSPARLGLPHALWSRKAVQQAIKLDFGIDMPIRTVGEYLRRWGFTPQRPAKRALEQRPEQVRQWLEVEYPTIVRRAKAEGALVHWADETAVRQDTAWVRGYAPEGHTPVIEHAARRPTPGITMISALTNQGLLRFGFHDGAINAERFIDFMAAVVHDSPAKVFLIVDNLAVHRAEKVRQWAQAKKDDIELFYLPPYSPQMNPDELVNRDLKTELRMRPGSSDRGTLKRIAQRFMEALSNMPQRVRAYFEDEQVVYACSRATYSV
ncbi:IS630 family transposase [Azohydromonas lata]|uniref:IS630 family transposase n=1 Tax=Azohydromonas lata TaxID=45677 RepID=A0ABU5ISA3_9BURK|nr:IS630 family transposase [Azohydromonas lata]MDZ5461769.1 IS630 family transposase [Azohydromonas lata]